MLVGSSIFGIFAFYKQERTISGMTEKELARLCKEGDEAARKMLYERYSKQMFGVCLRYAGHRAVAEDWLHDAFLKIYSTMDKFCYREEGSLKAWMMTVLHNCIIQHVRQLDVLEEAELMDEGMEVADEPYDDSLLGVDEGKIVAMVAILWIFQMAILERMAVGTIRITVTQAMKETMATMRRETMHHDGCKHLRRPPTWWWPRRTIVHG